MHTRVHTKTQTKK